MAVLVRPKFKLPPPIPKQTRTTVAKAVPGGRTLAVTAPSGQHKYVGTVRTS